MTPTKNKGEAKPAATAKIGKRRATTLVSIDDNNIIGNRLRGRNRSSKVEIDIWLRWRSSVSMKFRKSTKKR